MPFSEHPDEPRPPASDPLDLEREHLEERPQDTEPPHGDPLTEAGGEPSEGGRNIDR